MPEAATGFYIEKDVRNFVKFIGNHLRWRLFFNKVAGLRPASHAFFSVIFAKILRTPFLQNLRTAASGVFDEMEVTSFQHLNLF